MAKKIFQVEIKGKKEFAYFATKEEAESYAITMTAWSGGKYRIAQIWVKEEQVTQ